jgi:hypothetical protein
MTIYINGTTGISGVDGSAGTPAFQGTDTNTGISFGSDVIIGSTGGVERFRVDSQGRLGIGVTSPGAALTLGDTSAESGIQLGDGADFTIKRNVASLGVRFNSGLDLNNYQFQVGGNEVLRIDGSRLLVGTSSARSNVNGDTPQFQLEGSSFNTSAISQIASSNSTSTAPFYYLGRTRGSIGGNTIVQNGDPVGYLAFAGSDGTTLQPLAWIKGEVDGTPGANDMPGRLVFSTTADGASSPTERMRINSTGAVLIGRTTTGNIGDSFGTALGSSFAYFERSGAPALYIRRGTSTGDVVEFYQGTNTFVGSISVTASATAYNTSSDYRLKENVVSLTGAADRLNQLQVHRFNFIADPDTTVDGFIAHEAQEIVPECVTGEKDAVDADGNPIYQGIDQSKLVPLLTAALQEAITEIAALKDRVTALEAV